MWIHVLLLSFIDSGLVRLHDGYIGYVRMNSNRVHFRSRMFMQIYSNWNVMLRDLSFFRLSNSFTGTRTQLDL